MIVARVLKPLLVGMDPTEIDAIWDKAYVRGGHKEFGTRGIGVVALSGIDVALWDILGKVRGVPLYQLLGGKCRDKVPVYATALYPEEPAKVAARARAFADQGFHGVKIKVGFDLDQDIRIVRAVRAELGKDFIVMTDANQGYSAGCGPCKPRPRLPMRRVLARGAALRGRYRRACSAARERPKFRSPSARICIPAMLSKISSSAARWISSSRTSPAPAASPRSGKSPRWRRSTMFRFRFTPGATASRWRPVCTLSAALRDCIVMELDYTYNPLREELLREPFKVHSGFLTPPEKPGLGIELNVEALQRFAFAGSEELAVRQKTLGSA